MDIMLERMLELKGDAHGANKELADAIGIHPTRITDWKTGPLHPNRERWLSTLPGGFCYVFDGLDAWPLLLRCANTL